jgi:hypothetical protein
VHGGYHGERYKREVQEAALEMLSQNGYADTDIREPGASPGLVKSGIYEHMP